MFILAGVIHVCGVIFYGIFASGELQDWAEPKEGTEQLQMETPLALGALTGALPPGADGGAGGYYGATGAQMTQPTSAWNGEGAGQAGYGTWDDQQTGATATNPFAGGGGGVAGAGAGYNNYTDPNTAWGSNGTAGGAYAPDNNNTGASFYETRAQYVQPSTQYQ